MIPQSKMLEILEHLLKRTKANEVNWQPSGVDDITYTVNFPHSFVSITTQDDRTFEANFYKSSPESDVIIGRLRTTGPGTHHWDLLPELYREAGRAATGWDQVLTEIEEAVGHQGKIGLDL